MSQSVTYPNVVTLPPVLGGAVSRVDWTTKGQCPLACGQVVPILQLARHDLLQVADCPTHGFVWFQFTRQRLYKLKAVTKVL